jgi:CRP-like cAMP-binding protein
MSKPLPQPRNLGRSNCAACALRNDMVCSDVTLDDLVDFHAGIDSFDYADDAGIFAMGAPTAAVYCIKAGVVKMLRHDPYDGKHRIVRVLKKGDVAGLESAFSSHYEHSAIAVGEVRACRIPIAYFKNFIAKHAGLQLRLFEKSQAALREAENWLTQLVGTTPARTRLARLLIYLRIGETDRIHRLNLNDMAAIIGTTPETVSRIISDFGRQGLLAKGRNSAGNRFFIGDFAGLQSISSA